MFALFGPCIVKPDQVDAFIEVSIATGEASLKDEPGCLRYDVLRDRTKRNVIHFYELYTDKSAFDAHMGSAHYAHWEKTTKDMIEEELPGTEMDLLNLRSRPATMTLV